MRLYHPELDVVREFTERAAPHMKQRGWVDADERGQTQVAEGESEDTESKQQRKRVSKAEGKE